MCRCRGFTLLEMMVVIAIIALLVSILVPAVQSAQNSARIAVCQSGLKSLSAAVWMYTVENEGYFPPFAFNSTSQADLLLSGHWGGSQNPNDPDLFGRFAGNLSQINLTMLVHQNFVDQRALLCAGSDGALHDGLASYFAYSDQFSTYCLRFPHSEDLFDDAPDLAYFHGGHLLQIYSMAASGHSVPVPPSNHGGATYQTVPYVHSQRRYRVGGGVYDPAQSALLADAFWMQEYNDAPSGHGAKRVLRRRCHGNKYNVLFGHGGVATVKDDDTIENAAVAPGQQPPANDAPYYPQAETFWTYFDQNN